MRCCNPARLGLPLVLTVLLGGCASWQLLQSPTQRVSGDLQDHRYADALRVIDDADKTDPRYPALKKQRPTVVRASQDYRHQALTRAGALADKGQWQQAFTVLRDARDRVVDPKPVDALLKQLHQRERDNLRQLLADWYLAQAHALLQTDKLDSALKGHGDDRARETLKNRRQLRERLTGELTRLGDDFAGQGQWQSAYRTLQTAQRLNPKGNRSKILERARATLNRAQSRAQSARRQSHREHAQALIQQYQESNGLEDLLAARTYLLQYRDDDLSKQRQEVNQWCQQRFKVEVAHGDALYARGRYQAAYQQWKRAEPLDPDNKGLKKKLARARRVLRNLRNLTDPAD